MDVGFRATYSDTTCDKEETRVFPCEFYVDKK
jgi:hypothetical protein